MIGVLAIFAKVIVRPLFPTVLALASCVSLQAQELRFQHIAAEDGLSDNAVTCLFEDHEGYIWIGTERGLNRYDGQRVEHFEPGPNGPLGAHITSIAEDGKGRMWISTADAGLSMREPAGEFRHFQHESTDTRSLPTDKLNHVLVVDDSLLILSSQGSGAIWFHPRKGVLRRQGFRPSVLNTNGDTAYTEEDNWNHTAMRLDDGRIWLPMLRNIGSYVADARSGELVSVLAVVDQITNGVQADGVLFMGGWAKGVHRVDLAHPETSVHFQIDEEVTAIVEWDKHRLLAATKVSGLLWLDKNGTITGRCQHARSDPSSLRSDRTTCLLLDRNRNLWVGTAKGASVYAPSVWACEALPLMTDEREGDLVFHAIQEDDDGTIRLSTSKGFILVDPANRTSRLMGLSNGPEQLEVTGLYKAGPEQWFVGTETGIFRYDHKRERILTERECGTWSRYHAGSMFQTRAAWPAVVGGRDALLVGALGYGHIALDRSTGAWVTAWEDYSDRDGTLMLRSTLQDRSGTFWSATVGGVVRWIADGPDKHAREMVFSTRAQEPHRLAGDDAQALAIQGDTIWVALRDAGLASITGDQAHAHRPPAHMPNDVLGVTVDRYGDAWCTTGNGLLRYSPRSDAWLHVPVNDGLDFRQLTKCITTLRDGRIGFCADDHLLFVDPAMFQRMKELPAPRLVGTSNTWGALLTDAEGSLELPYSNSALDLMLTALQPVGAAPLTFLCRLDDEKEGYRAVTAREPLRYAGVPTGTRRLLVRVRDAYGREGPEHALLAVTVIGPFWQRWWFFVLVLAVGALGMYVVSRFRQRQRTRLQHVRDRIARDLHDDIGSTLGSISFYSEALKRKLRDTDDAMAQQVAEKIGASSREMIDQMSDIVWSVDPKNDDAEALGKRLRAFAGDLLAARNIPLDFRIEGTLNDRKLSAEQRRNLFLICKEVLHNAVKYADAGRVTIDMIAAGRTLEISIADDGRGFDPANTDSYNGNGLPNMRARAEAIGASFTINSAPGKGTRARVALAQSVLTPRSGD